jgi:hypothetical protein
MVEKELQGKRTIHAKTVNARCTEAHLTLYPSSLRSASYRQVRLTGGYDLGGAPGHLQHLPRTLTTTTFIIPLTKLSQIPLSLLLTNQHKAGATSGWPREALKEV